MAARTSYQHGQFCWVDLMAHDVAKAKVFYSALLGWQAVDLDTGGGPVYVQFELNSQSVAGLGEMPADMRSAGVPPVWNSYINVDDVEAAAAETVSQGGQVTLPVMQVMEAGTMCFIQDPTGAFVGLWQKNQHFGAQLVNDPGCFCWNELATRDVAGASKFYSELLGWSFTQFPEGPPGYQVIQNGDQINGGMMQMTEQFGDMPPCWTVYFAVEDCDAAASQVAALGGQVMVPPFDIPVGRMAVVADDQGAVLSLIKLNQTDA